MAMPRRHTVAEGQSFGRLTVLREVRIGGVRHVVCRCGCGSPEVTVTLLNLVYGRQHSCGCLKRELVAERNRSEQGREWVRGGWGPCPEGRERLAELGRSPERLALLAEWSRAPRVGSRNEKIDAPDTPMWCPVCGEPVASERAFDRHYRTEHRA
jgi:hypothetical protein